MDIDSQEEILQMLDDCEKRYVKLTEWEKQFVQSLSEQLGDWDLTDKQVKTLGDIWERIT